jgi:hypothetical protein
MAAGDHSNSRPRRDSSFKCQPHHRDQFAPAPHVYDQALIGELLTPASLLALLVPGRPKECVYAPTVLTKGQNENHVFIAFSLEENSGIDITNLANLTSFVLLADR